MLEVYKAIDAIVDRYGVELPELYKRRDPNEPYRAEKEMWEDRFFKAMRARFRAQYKIIKERLSRTLPERKSVKIDTEWILDNMDIDDPDTRKKLLQVFIGIMEEGTQQYAVNSELQIDWTQHNEDALQWVNEHYYNHLAGDPKLGGWLEEIDSAVSTSLGRELGNFVKEEAYTLGDVMAGIRGSALSDARAHRIAVTEITRVFSQADQLAGEAVAEEYPDVKVVKTWWTNNDALVCPICGPLHGVSVLVRDYFPGDFEGPPAHPNCRCWRSTRTDILGEVELG